MSTAFRVRFRLAPALHRRNPRRTCLDGHTGRAYDINTMQRQDLRGRMIPTSTRFAISFAGTILAAAQASAYEVPGYEPDYWNTDECVQWMNNCYNYAMNKATHTFAQPGREYECSLAQEEEEEECRPAPEECDLSYEPGDSPLLPMEGSLTDPFEICDYVAWYAVMDGSIAPVSLTNEAKDPGECGGGPGYTKVALVVRHDFEDVEDDYHWYRRDNDGTWSHKPGSTPATNLDGCGKVITDPEKLITDSALVTNPEDCKPSSYETFCGYYCTASTSKEQGTGTMVIN